MKKANVINKLRKEFGKEIEINEEDREISVHIGKETLTVHFNKEEETSLIYTTRDGMKSDVTSDYFVERFYDNLTQATYACKYFLCRLNNSFSHTIRYYDSKRQEAMKLDNIFYCIDEKDMLNNKKRIEKRNGI